MNATADQVDAVALAPFSFGPCAVFDRHYTAVIGDIVHPKDNADTERQASTLNPCEDGNDCDSSAGHTINRVFQVPRVLAFRKAFVIPFGLCPCALLVPLPRTVLTPRD